MLSKLPPGSVIYLVTLEKEDLPAGDVAGYSQIINLPFRYLPFGRSALFGWFKNIVRLRRLIRNKQVQVIHAFCTTAGTIGYLLSRLSGKQLIIDSYEPHAEAMVENGEWSPRSFAYRILFYFERKQSEQAQKIIGAAPGMQEYAKKKYGVSLREFFVKPACVDLNAFQIKDKKHQGLLQELDLKDKIVCVYAGKFGGIYLKEEVFNFYKSCYAFWGSRFVALILTNQAPAELVTLADNYGLPPSMFRIQFVPHAQIPLYLGLGDFGITPVKPVPTKRYCTPVKNGEYWAMGLPVVITKDISIDSALIETEGIGYVLKSLEENEYIKAIERIDQLIKDTSLPAKIRKIAERERNFTTAQRVYDLVYAS